MTVRRTLAGDMKPDAPLAAGKSAVVSNGNAKLTIDGFGRCEKSNNGGYDLQFETPAG